VAANPHAIADNYPLPKRRIRWVGLVFFVFLHAVGLIGTPLYLYYYGITAPELALFFFFPRRDRHVDDDRLSPSLRARHVQDRARRALRAPSVSARRRSRNPR
jgi:hypothetical protein